MSVKEKILILKGKKKQRSKDSIMGAKSLGLHSLRRVNKLSI